jgi:hypothetical protein
LKESKRHRRKNTHAKITRTQVTTLVLAQQNQKRPDMRTQPKVSTLPHSTHFPLIVNHCHANSLPKKSKQIHTVQDIKKEAKAHRKEASEKKRKFRRQ